MSGDVVLWGVGEIGGVFAKGLLRAGHTVHPVTRHHGPNLALKDPALVLVTVGEADLPAVLRDLPDSYRSRLGLVQNELLPPAWTEHGIEDPTVAVIWFEKKPGRPVQEILPSVLGGPQAALLEAAL